MLARNSGEYASAVSTSTATGHERLFTDTTAQCISRARFVPAFW